jgi:aspartyl aminopeptidase
MSDSRSASLFLVACDALEIPLQDFNNRSDLACGSTVGPFAASQLGITTVDVGCAMLSMHSAREQAGAEDVDDFVRVIAHLLGGR